MARKHETPAQREDRLLHQSFLDDVVVEPLTRAGRYAMRSAHTPKGVVYIASVGSCTCPWACEHQSDGLICKHIARARFESEFTQPFSRVDLVYDRDVVAALRAAS